MPRARQLRPAARLTHLRDLRGGERGVEPFTRAILGARRGTLAAPQGLSNVEAYAVVNHGRWIVNCPFCPGAELADPEDPRFYCLSCGNKFVDHAWLPVIWPDERAVIEAVLMKRPQEHTRNYTHEETPADLLRENAAKGVS